MELDTLVETELRMGTANQVVFAETLEALAAEDRAITAVTSDSRGSGKLVGFGQRFPKQIVELGIAEQNLVGVAAGLAAAGKKAFAVSPACFLSARALEQIKNDVAYSNNPVTLVGISAGVSYGALGSTHHSLHDFAALRAIHNLIVVAPADNFETREAVLQAAALQKPVYLRFGKKAMPYLNDGNTQFAFGKGRIILEGSDLTFIANGETVYPAWQAARYLEQHHGIQAGVVSMHTVKPLDEVLLHEIAENGKPIITVEEHMVHGGLGEACAAYLMQHRFHNPFRIVGLPDADTVTGSQLEIFDHYGITTQGLANCAKELIESA